jgi:uncharacterized protein involved in copper resistance
VRSSRPRCVMVSIERIATGRRSEARRDMNGAGVPGMHGGDEMHSVVPVRTDPLQVDTGTTDLAHALRDQNWNNTSISKALLRAAGTDRQVPKPQKCRVPAVHRGPLQTGTIDPAQTQSASR